MAEIKGLFLLSLFLYLIIQSSEGEIVSTTTNSVPVIGMLGSYSAAIPAVINFLRGGCPAVQLVDMVERFGGRLPPDWIQEFVVRMNELSMNEEKFIVTEGKYIILVTRETK